MYYKNISLKLVEKFSKRFVDHSKVESQFLQINGTDIKRDTLNRNSRKLLKEIQVKYSTLHS